MKNTLKTISIITVSNSMFIDKEGVYSHMVRKSFYDTVRICIDFRTKEVITVLTYLNKRL